MHALLLDLAQSYIYPSFSLCYWEFESIWPPQAPYPYLQKSEEVLPKDEEGHLRLVEEIEITDTWKAMEKLVEKQFKQFKL